MTKLAVALDFRTREEFAEAINIIGTRRPVLKLGLRLLPRLNFSDIEALKAKGFEIFVDVKLHDIPSQVASSIETWAELGVDYLTLHLGGGREMIRASVEALSKTQNSSMRLLGVSVLTSLGDADLAELGIERKSSEQVLHLVRLAWVQELKSFVASANELSIIKSEFPKAFVCTPGLSLGEQSNEGQGADQKRTLSYTEALERGSDLLVMGRSVWNSPSPEATLDTIIEKIRVYANEG